MVGQRTLNPSVMVRIHVPQFSQSSETNSVSLLNYLVCGFPYWHGKITSYDGTTTF